MALGITGLDDYAPNRRGTATSIINAIAPDSQKKTTTLQIRVNDDVYQLFKEACETNGTDVSKALRAYVQDYIAHKSRNGEAAISDLSVQNVRTNENGPLKKQSEVTAPSYKLDLRNKEQREEWVRNFRSWGVWLDVPEVNKHFYRFNFINGCAIIVEVGVEYWDSFSVHRGSSHERIAYSIIDNEHQKFNSQGDSFTSVIQWLSKYAKEI